jgi:predicted metal-dependent HD superfamily phosphohydrolase
VTGVNVAGWFAARRAAPRAPLRRLRVAANLCSRGLTADLVHSQFAMISPERLELLQQSWVRLLGRLGVGPAAAYPPFDDLVARYGEPHRHYHTLEHMAEVLKVAAKLADLGGDADAIALAVWYHDAVYDPRAKDNEERSAQLAVAALAPLGVPKDLLEKVADLIRATAHTAATPADVETAILLDADLAILGAEEGRYRRYTDAIRQEYAWVADADYRAGRARVLEAFLARDRIYRTERMFAAGEEAARANLRGEIERLRE